MSNSHLFNWKTRLVNHVQVMIHYVTHLCKKRRRIGEGEGGREGRKEGELRREETGEERGGEIREEERRE